MDEKELKQMMWTYRELASVRRNILLAMQEAVYQPCSEPEEKVDRVKSLLKAAGIYIREESV